MIGVAAIYLCPAICTNFFMLEGALNPFIATLNAARLNVVLASALARAQITSRDDLIAPRKVGVARHLPYRLYASIVVPRFLEVPKIEAHAREMRYIRGHGQVFLFRQMLLKPSVLECGNTRVEIIKMRRGDRERVARDGLPAESSSPPCLIVRASPCKVAV
jgi:hypothetical protein